MLQADSFFFQCKKQDAKATQTFLKKQKKKERDMSH